MTRRTPLKRSAPPKRKSWLKRQNEVKKVPKARKPRKPPVPKWVLNYWEWVGAQPCVVCRKERDSVIECFGGEAKGNIQCSPTEVAHVGVRGLRQKCDPREVLPLCGVLHHRLGPYSHHRLGKRFWEFHGLDREALLRQYQERYESETGLVLASPGKAEPVGVAGSTGEAGA